MVFAGQVYKPPLCSWANSRPCFALQARGFVGSNPTAPTKFLQLSGLFETLIGGPATTAGNHRCILPDGKGAQGAWQHPLRPPGSTRCARSAWPGRVTSSAHCRMVTSPTVSASRDIVQIEGGWLRVIAVSPCGAGSSRSPSSKGTSPGAWLGVLRGDI